MLLKWGLEKADAANAKCYLESTPDAYALYCKYGFHKVDELVTDLRGYGEEDAHVIKIMIREPKSCS
jgi:hypothetical protein